MSFRKTVCLILSVLMLAGTLAACGKPETGNGRETDSTRTETSDKTDYSGSAVRDLSDLPAGLDFNGATFTAMTRNTCGSMTAEELTGDGINDSVYNRNLLAEERLKVKIREVKSENTKIPELETSVKAGEQIYSAAMTHVSRMADLVQKGYFINLADIPYLDTDKPYWSTSLINSLTIGDKSYLFAGDMSIADDAWLVGVYFNKELAENLALGDFYKMVDDGTWVMDVVIKDTAIAGNDLNGDGRWDWDTDQFGMVGLYDALPVCYNAMGQMSTVRDENDGHLSFALETESSVSALMKLAGWVSSGASTYLLDVSRVETGDPYADLVSVILSGRGLFHIGAIQTIFSLRDMEQPFGILPMPKADEKQEAYITSIQEGGYCVFAVPVCAPDLEMTGAVLECLSGLSTDTIRKAFYDVALTRRYSRDQESAASLDILYGNVVVDPGRSYFGLSSTIKEIAQTGVVSSKLKSKEKSVNNQIKQAEKIIGRLDH